MMGFSRLLAEWLETLNLAIAVAIIAMGSWIGYRIAFANVENLTFGTGLGFVGGLIVAALICGLIANLSLIEQHLALIADDIDEMRAMEAEDDKETSAKYKNPPPMKG